MTPKDKAKELVDKYKPLCKDLKSVGILDGRAVYINDDVLNNASAKQCALIAVDELIREENSYNNGSFYPSRYWQEVKQEILKL